MVPRPGLAWPGLAWPGLAWREGRPPRRRLTSSPVVHAGHGRACDAAAGRTERRVETQTHSPEAQASARVSAQRRRGTDRASRGDANALPRGPRRARESAQRRRATDRASRGYADARVETQRLSDLEVYKEQSPVHTIAHTPLLGGHGATHATCSPACQPRHRGGWQRSLPWSTLRDCSREAVRAPRVGGVHTLSHVPSPGHGARADGSRDAVRLPRGERVAAEAPDGYHSAQLPRARRLASHAAGRRPRGKRVAAVLAR